MSLVWTRASADWDEDRVLLDGVGGVVRMPCVRIAPTAYPAEQFDVYVVVSPHAVAHFSLPRAAAVHTFGAATARAAARAGAHVTRHEARTAAELASILVRVLDKTRSIGLPGAAEPAFDLAGALRAGGLKAQAVPCYRTEVGAEKEDGSPFPAAERLALAASLSGVVCFASPSAVRGFVDAFPGTALTAACIGPTTAKVACKHFQRVVIAPENSLPALVATAQSQA